MLKETNTNIKPIKQITMRTIEEKNRMIAEFMGGKDQSKLIGGTNEILFESPSYAGSKPSRIYTPFANLKYHTSWDWLMPVVEKIEKLGFTIEKNFQHIDNDWQCLVVKGNDILFQEFNEQSIQAMHNAVVKFIEMYNQKN